MTGERWDFYADRFAREYAEGADLEGEARFVDVLAPRGARVLDAGCGTGRIAAALHRMGHTAVGADRDAGLVEIARQRYPGPLFLTSDLLALTPDALVAAGGPASFDVIVLAGNVMVYLAPGSERDVLRVLARAGGARRRDRHRVPHRPRLHGACAGRGRRRGRVGAGAPVRHLAPGAVGSGRRVGRDGPSPS